MKLKKIKVKNFRSYSGEHEICFDDLTVLVGKNDAGKSTILEALDIFFNSDKIKMESTDLNISSVGSDVHISCVFSDFPTELSIDSKSVTSLVDEYLLNKDGELEIVKSFDCSLKTPKAATYIKCIHPSKKGYEDLLSLKNTELKGRIQELGVEGDIDKRSNVSCRRGIWESEENLDLVEQAIILDKEDGKKIWGKIEDYLPNFALFQSDRPSKDEDDEVQDPMKLAIKEAMDEVKDDLEKLKEAVQKKAKAVADATIEKLREMDPDLAKDFHAHFKTEPKWDGIFKLSLTDEDQIPINKRGSGTRRLILLNFFRAKADKKNTTKKSTIYAIEEPETSQHPSNQEMLIKSLISLSEQENHQIVVTTHVPALAGMIPISNLRYIYTQESGEKTIANNCGNEDLRIIADALGVLPDGRVQVIVCVEGANDIAFLKNITPLVRSINPALPDICNDPRISILPLGGSSLKQWVTQHYSKNFNLPEVHIYDRDDETPPKYEQAFNIVNARTDRSKAFLTLKREMENYIHPDAIRLTYTEYGISVSFTDKCDVPDIVAQAVHSKSYLTNGGNPSLVNPWETLDDDKKDKKRSKVKRRLNEEAVRHMTKEMYQKIDSGNEIISWFLEVHNLLK